MKRSMGGRRTASGRRRPAPFQRDAAPHYPAHLEVRRVSPGGTISWQGHLVFLSEVLRGEDVALEEVAEDCWNILYYTTCSHAGTPVRSS